jgi:Holliday junction resolvase RusA-like endonuclease
MGQALKLTVYTVPVAQPRQRMTIVAGHVHNYTPADSPVNTYKADLRRAVRDAGLSQVIDAPVRLTWRAYLPRPKRLMRRSDPDGPVPHTSKPDLDNIAKATRDALNRLAWRDDSLLYEETGAKYYCEKDGLPRVELEIEEL